MELKSHIELFIFKGTVDSLPHTNINGTHTNGAIKVHNLTVELSGQQSIMPDEIIHQGDTVYFFLVPTKYITGNYENYDSFTAVNVSRFRRRIWIDGTTYTRPCSFGTTIPCTPVNTKGMYNNFCLTEHNDLIITSAETRIKPFEIFEDDRNLPDTPCPYNPDIQMNFSTYTKPLTSRWE